MKLQEKEVYFDQYCYTCKYFSLFEDEEPCSECLENPVTEYSHKPIKYEKAKSNNQHCKSKEN